MNRKVFVFVLALLAGIVLLAGQSAVGASAGYTDWTDVEDVEPNDTLAQAVPVAYESKLNGFLDLSDTVDYFTFSGTAGDKIALPFDGDVWHATYEIALLNSALNPIELTGPANWVVLPANGDYYIQVTKTATYDEGNYRFYLTVLTGDEPNDTRATATPVEALATVAAVTDYPCDTDWYRFEGRAGDMFPVPIYSRFSMEHYDYALYDEAGVELPRGTNLLPSDGTYYMMYFGDWTDDHGDGACREGPYTVTIGYPLWVSSNVNGLGGNALIKEGDIAMRANQPGTWRIVFDASDVGITRDVQAIERLDDGSILMSLHAAQNVAGVGRVMPNDILRFVPTSLGDNTAGRFELFLDGSDVGLTTSGERIDAIHFKPYEEDPNPLAISIVGNGSVPKQAGGTLKFRDEDLINFVGLSYGHDTQGAWRMELDGSSVPGMATEDISASTYIKLEPARISRLLLVFTNTYTIDGMSGGPRDLFGRAVYGQSGQMFETMVFKNLTDKKIDALSVGVGLMP